MTIRNRAVAKVGLAVFGDSHAQFCFDRIKEAQINWLGPVTMHRVGRDGAWFLNGWQPVEPGLDVVFIFGEIDVRCHIGRISDETSVSRQELCTQLVDRYLNALEMHRPALDIGRIVVSCVPPPADGAGLDNIDFPVYGTWADRAEITRLLNHSLREGCAARNVLFLDFLNDYSTPEGFIISDLSDGSVHIAKRHTGAVVAKLEALLQRRLAVDEELEASVVVSRQKSQPSRLAGWKTRFFGKTLAQPHLDHSEATQGGSIAFLLPDYDLQGNASVLRKSPLRISASQDPWAYIATWQNLLTVSDAIGSGLRVELNVELLEGAAEAGLLATDFSTFLHRTELVAGKQTVVLEVPQATSVKAMVLRNLGTAMSTMVEVTGIHTHLVQEIRAKERGFLAKDPVADLAKRLMAPEVVIVDVGANRGETVARFLDSFSSARIWALEPHPETYRKLQERFAKSANIHFCNLALSANDGHAVLHSYTNTAINSLSPVASGAHRLMDGEIVAAQEATVELRTLESFCTFEQIERIDILKLDTQGHENDIIEGSLNLFASGKIKYVLAELIFAQLYAKQAKAGEVIALLEKCGFRLLDMYDFVYGDEQNLKWGDALFQFVGRLE